MPATRQISPQSLAANIANDIAVPNMTPADDEVSFVIRLQEWPFAPDEGPAVISITFQYADKNGVVRTSPRTIGADWGYGRDRATGLLRKDLPGGCPIFFGFAALSLRDRRVMPTISFVSTRGLEIIGGSISTSRSGLPGLAVRGRSG